MDAQSSTAGGPAHLPITFAGRAGAYFGIWIVNLLLSIITIGIYSAWAKVRRVRYFYGNTFIGDHALDYHAKPIAILKGRIIVVAVIAGVGLVNQANPIIGGVASLALALLVPLGILYSLRFNARVTSWRNVRFNFDTVLGRDYLRALGVFVLMPAVAAISLGLLLPVATRMAWNFVLRRLSYGTTRFSTNIPLAPLYRALLATVLLAAGFAVVLGLVGYAVLLQGALSAFSNLDNASDEIAMVAFFLPAILGAFASFIVLMIAATFYSALARNAILGNTEVDGMVRLASNISGLRMAWIVVSNSFAVLLTVGLATPWAAVRSWRYRSQSMSGEVIGDLDAIVAADAAAGHAVGSEWADIEGFDVGF